MQRGETIRRTTSRRAGVLAEQLLQSFVGSHRRGFADIELRSRVEQPSYLGCIAAVDGRQQRRDLDQMKSTLANMTSSPGSSGSLVCG